MTARQTFDKVVVLDRDGTITVDRGYLSEPAGLEFLPGTAEGLHQFQAMGFSLVVITNQSGVGRGLIALERLHAMNERLAEMIRGTGAELAGIYYCPHSPEQRCTCRKPGTELLLRAAADLGFEASRAIIIGDKASDIEMGTRVGAVTLLIAGDDGRPQTSDPRAQPHAIVRNLTDAARYVAARSPKTFGEINPR